jgi:exopolyphosphatase / guanosine-5'-triphosphate,3'-diphosphate pyrophosphatase
MLLAAVDVGSNSFRLETARADGSHLERRGYWKEIVRLAAGLDESNRLSKKAIDAASECLARINERLRGMPASHVRAVGTETLRQALNTDQFLLEAQHALGYPIEVISGREEARLVFEGCMHSLAPSVGRRLVVDIGGASSEVIVGRSFEADKADSFKVGCLNVTLKFFPDGVIDRASLRRAQVACEAEFEEAEAFFGPGRWDEAYGTSGTIGAVSLVLRDQGWTDGTITAPGIARLRQALLAAGDVRRVRFDGIKQERAAVLAGGLAVLAAIFETFGLHELRTAKGGLRLGVLYDLLGRRESHDIRDATVDRWQLRFGVDRAQSARVAQTALGLFRAVAPSADQEAVKRLLIAAQLHEIGTGVSHGDYHKHSAYLIEHGDLPGFSVSDQKSIAELALGQRGNLKKVSALLEEPERAAALLALRLAVIMHHARRDVVCERWTLRFNRSIDLGLERSWLDRHPLTRHLLEEEAEQWQRVGMRFTVREVA